MSNAEIILMINLDLCLRRKRKCCLFSLSKQALGCGLGPALPVGWGEMCSLLPATLGKSQPKYPTDILYGCQLLDVKLLTPFFSPCHQELHWNKNRYWKSFLLFLIIYKLYVLLLFKWYLGEILLWHVYYSSSGTWYSYGYVLS